MMIIPKRWVERSFKFELPVTMFPNVVERLRGTPARLVERLSGIPEAVRTQPFGDGWSIQEHAGHLLDLEDLWLHRMREFAAGVHVLSAADMANRKTTDAGHNTTPLEEILARFRRARLDIITHLEGLEEPDVQRTAMHPRLMQPMNVIDLAFFVAEHDDHHLARITEILMAGHKR